jgi:predicted transcriptional regulator
MDRPESTLDPIPNEDAQFAAAVEAGKASLDAGRSAPYEAVRRWLLSWGADKELPPPECP